MATNKLFGSKMRFIGVFFLMMICTFSANAQFLRTSYFMEGTHYRQQLNPALAPTKGIGRFYHIRVSRHYGHH